MVDIAYKTMSKAFCKCFSFIKISLKFVPKYLFDNKSALV